MQAEESKSLHGFVRAIAADYQNLHKAIQHWNHPETKRHLTYCNQALEFVKAQKCIRAGQELRSAIDADDKVNAKIRYTEYLRANLEFLGETKRRFENSKEPVSDLVDREKQLIEYEAGAQLLDPNQPSINDGCGCNIF